jgi:hypothetical protein
MPLVSVSLPNLISGVSQQPHTMRLNTSCTELINGWPSVVTGLSKRPPTENITKLNINVDNNASAYLIDKDNDYRFIVVIDNGDLKVFDIFGTEQTVNFPVGKGYLAAASSPAEDFRFLTVGDYTFILNREVIVGRDSYGELGAGNYTADGQVQNTWELPSGVANGTVYLVDSDDSYWKYTNKPEVPQELGWQAISTWADTGSAAPNYPALPVTVTVNRQIDLVRQVITGTRKEKRGKTFVNVHTYKKQYRTYKGVVARAYQAAVQGWTKVRKADLINDILGYRRNPKGRATVYVTQSVANQNYTVYINGVQKATFLTSKGVDATSSVQGTDVIAGSLVQQLQTAGYAVAQYGSTISLSGLADGTTVTAYAGQGDKSLRCYTTTVGQFSDLPPNEVEGRIIQVKGSLKDNGDDYWVVYQKGVWSECAGFGEGEVAEAKSMPWRLVRNADGTWTFEHHTWLGRAVGDEGSNKGPSFVGFRLNDIFIYGNRLGFLADENVILSEAGVFENFYRTTITTTLDSDPIDLAVLNTGNDVLYHAIPFNKDLILGSDRNQYRLTYNGYLSAKNIQIQFTTAYAMSNKVKPHNMGNSVYFVDDKPTYNYGKLWEYYPKENNQGDDAEEVTAPVPEYIPAGIRYMATSTRTQAIVLNTLNDPASLYVYKYYWAGDRKVQNAWQRWTFADCTSVYWVGFSQDYLYLILQRGDGIYLERMKFDENISRNEVSSRILVDRQVQKEKLTLSFNANDTVLGKTTITLPYALYGVTPEVVASWYGDDEHTITDLRHEVEVLSPTQVKVTGDLTTANLVTVGLGYQFFYQFTTPYLREKKGSGEVVVLDGTRLQLRYMTIEYIDTAFFQTVLKYPGREDVTTTFDGKITGDATFIIGTTPYVTGKFRVPLFGNNKDCTLIIVNDAPYNCSFGSAEWNAVYAPRVSPRLRF